MLLALSWWGWAGLGVLGVVALLLASWRSYRKGIRRELVDYLRQHAPEVRIVAVHADRLELRPEGAAGEGGTFYFARLYQAVSELPGGALDEARPAREALYANVVKMLRDSGPGLDALDLETERPNVLPRLLHDAGVSGLRRAMEANGQRLPVLPSGVAGLSIVFVLDREAAVAYLNEEMLAELALTPDQALDLARANLARRFSRDVVRQAVAGGAFNVVKSGDTFDAARLLVVPGYLEAGEALAAIVPDRDTLVLTAPPSDGDWAALRKIARAADGDPLFTEPIVVTPEGLTRAA
jgi:hypothetical protein